MTSSVDQQILQAQKEQQVLLKSLKEAVAIMERGEPLPALLFIAVKKVENLGATGYRIDHSTGVFVGEGPDANFVTHYLFDTCRMLAEKLALSAVEHGALPTKNIKGTH